MSKREKDLVTVRAIIGKATDPVRCQWARADGSTRGGEFGIETGTVEQ